MWNKSRVLESQCEILREEAQNWKESFTAQLICELMDDQEVMATRPIDPARWRFFARHSQSSVAKPLPRLIKAC